MRRSIAVGAFGSLGGRLRFTHLLHNCGGSFFIVKNEFFSEHNLLVVDDDRARDYRRVVMRIILYHLDAAIAFLQLVGRSNIIGHRPYIRVC